MVDKQYIVEYTITEKRSDVINADTPESAIDHVQAWYKRRLFQNYEITIHSATRYQKVK